MLRWLAPTALLLLVACAAPTGSLQIDVSGLPAGQDAVVTITGPNNYGATVSESTTLTGLTPGAYQLQAADITTTAVISEYVATITPQSFGVNARETATASVTYAPRGGTLALAITGLPVGLDADVNVAGPNTFTQDVSASTLLEVAPGEYTATANPITDGNHSYTPTITNSPAEVSSSAGSAIEVVYTLDAGSLQITIDGLPTGVDANVLVEGENGYSEVVGADTTLTGLVPGLYRVTARNARTDHPIVSGAFGARVRVMAVEVVSNGLQSVSASYSLIPSSGRLWTPHLGTEIVTGFAAAKLLTTGAPTPDATLTGSFAAHEGIAFDGEGNAWITNKTTDTLERYDAADLASDGSPSPSVTIGGLNDPVGLAFDVSGNLFIADGGSNEIVVFTPDQLLTSGSPTPSVTISSTGGSLDGSHGVAFDASGDLWVTNFSGDTIVRFGASQLLSSGSPVPEVTIDDGAGGNLDTPAGVAFDAAGDLWVANFGGPWAILKFEDPGSLSGVVDPTPAAVLTGVTRPSGLVFDNSGSLWVASWPFGDLFRFDDPGSLSDAVSPTANAEVDRAAQINFGLIALYPPPVDLPITTP